MRVSHRQALAGGIAFAVFAPLLLVFNWPPSPTLINQAVAFSAWGFVTVFGGLVGAAAGARSSAAAALIAALVLVAASAVASCAFGALPFGIAAASAAVVAAAAVAVYLGTALSDRLEGAVLHAFLWGLLVAGAVSSLIAMVQVFAPDWADGDWIARASQPGRAGGNLRQPNHLSSVLLWSLIALIGLLEWRRWPTRPWFGALWFLLCLALVLTGSRTGVLGVLILAAWALADRRLSRSARIALLTLPLLYVALRFGVTTWLHAVGHDLPGEGRMSLVHGGDISSSRFAIWSNTLSMIAHDPWTGVGFGEFNFAWTLSAFATRPVAFFDHTHNLPLQLLVELGIPLGALVLGLLVIALLQAARRAWACEGEWGAAKRAAFMLVLMIGLHSLLEYPLWYAHFLLPAAFAWGVSLAHSNAEGAPQPPGVALPAAGPQATSRPHRALSFAGLVLGIGAAAALLDYRSVVVIYDPPDNAATLEARIARGQRSPLFGHHADYAAATAFGPPRAPLSASQTLAFRRAPHQLLDVRLLIAWSQALAAQGELDKARWLAARIREFRNPGADEYFAPCSDAAEASHSFQCQSPAREFDWREFIER